MSQDKIRSKALKLIIGFTLVVLGVSCILVFWKDVVSVFKGFGGIVLALSGLLAMYTAKD
ncbi:MAG: hypothetical protein HQL27_01600 [Candidatus Omnitrophica bacterium]|nr:hypothetical protein [Candidatus Omnitrophota bacterium]